MACFNIHSKITRDNRGGFTYRCPSVPEKAKVLKSIVDTLRRSPFLREFLAMDGFLSLNLRICNYNVTLRKSYLDPSVTNLDVYESASYE